MNASISAPAQRGTKHTRLALALAALLTMGLAGGVSAADPAPKAAEAGHATHGTTDGPRTLTGYVDQEEFFMEFLKKNHPMFTI